MGHVWTVAATSADVLVVDFTMQGALASAVLAHSSVAGLVPPPESPMGAARLTARAACRHRRLIAGLTAKTRAAAPWDYRP